LQKAYAFLKTLGIPYYRIAGKMSSKEKQKIIAKFNDPDDPIEVMICSSRTSSLGLNLYKACYRLVL